MELIVSEIICFLAILPPRKLLYKFNSPFRLANKLNPRNNKGFSFTIIVLAFIISLIREALRPSDELAVADGQAAIVKFLGWTIGDRFYTSGTYKVPAWAYVVRGDDLSVVVTVGNKEITFPILLLDDCNASLLNDASFIPSMKIKFSLILMDVMEIHKNAGIEDREYQALLVEIDKLFLSMAEAPNDEIAVVFHNNEVAILSAFEEAFVFCPPKREAITEVGLEKVNNLM